MRDVSIGYIKREVRSLRSFAPLRCPPKLAWIRAVQRRRAVKVPALSSTPLFRVTRPRSEDSRQPPELVNDDQYAHYAQQERADVHDRKINIGSDERAWKFLVTKS